MKNFHGYSNKMEYAISKLNMTTDDRNMRSECDSIISAYTRMLPNGIYSMNKREIDAMIAELAAEI